MDALAEPEVDLYAQWERSAGRTVRGLGGIYRVVYQGKRNGGPGPDYLGAALVFPDGSMHRGDVEIHLQRESWQRHQHRWDPLYREVILHVIATGSLEPVTQGQWRAIPTVPLPKEPSYPSPCENQPQVLAGFKAQSDFLRALGAQRWWRRLAEWRDCETPQVFGALARRLGAAQHRFSLVPLWMNLLSHQNDLYSFLYSIFERLNLHDLMGLKRDLPGRIMFLSALAHVYHVSSEKLLTWSPKDVQRLTDDLQESGFKIPTKAFVTEVIGNWLLPLSQIKSGRDRFEDWYQLPLGWHYGRVRRHIERLGLQKPRSYGDQQALLEWMETLCESGECAWCPAMSISDDI